MLPLNYLADTQGYRCSAAWLYDDVPGDLKACSNCGVVKFYPDKSKEIKESVSSPKARKKSNDTFKRLIEELNEEAKNLGYIEE